MFSLRPYQVEAKQAVLNEWDKGQRKTLLVLPTGCHALGEKLLMADGTVRSVENINIGDKLLGADGNPRTVLYKHMGNDLLYRIKPEKGEPFIVTGDHKLTLVSIKNSFRKTEEISDITVSKWLSWTEDRRAKYMLIRSGSIAEFPLANKEILRIYPYFMGIFLSDKRFESLRQGSRNIYLYNQIEYYGLANSTNISKYIPHQYKTAPLSQRLEVIAGLLDQDGYLGDDCYYFETKSRSMAEDFEFMCRSVGLSANVIGCYKGLEHFFKVQIFGDCSIIPCRTLRYKTSFLDCEKSAQRSHFIAYPAYKGDYIGFTVDGDNRYLMHDFTITHNCGKTVVFSSITEHQVNKGHRVLIMAHRGELLTQAADKLKAATGLDSVLEKAESSSLGSIFPVTVGSVQSLAQEKRLARFPNDYFQDIIVDEAHHCLSGTYQRVLEHFTQSNILGVTATPDRGDMKNLGEFFDSKAYEYSMIQAIRDGYLCPIKAQMIPLELDIKNVGISNGDYSAGEIGHALEPYLHQIAAEMKKCCQGRKTVVFLPLIAISQKFCKILNDIGFKAAEVNGGSDDRTQVLSDFENGKYDVLCNSMLLTEGWDCPSVDCIVVLRPTKNRSLYQQIVGRGLRLYPGKEHLLLLDFLWMTTRHDLCKPSSLISKNNEIAKKIDKHIEDTGEVDLIEAEEQAERDVLSEREEALAEELRKLRTRKKQFVDPLQYALSIAAEDLATYTPTFEWEMKPPTKAQLSIISSRGVDTDCVTCAGYASMLIDKLIRRQEAGLSTPKQIRLLEKYGFREVGTWEFSQASNMISTLASHNWRLPIGLIPKAYKPN